MLDDSHAILFITSLSEYNQVLREDAFVSRIEESLHLFNEICNGMYFHSTAIILFLNKIDLFEIKITHTNITVAFPDYEGPRERDCALEYIRVQFISLNNNKNRKIYQHVTSATDTARIQVVIDMLFDIIISASLKMVGV